MDARPATDYLVKNENIKGKITCGKKKHSSKPGTIGGKRSSSTKVVGWMEN